MPSNRGIWPQNNGHLGSNRVDGGSRLMPKFSASGPGGCIRI